jgi:hypothetical protein
MELVSFFLPAVPFSPSSFARSDYERRGRPVIFVSSCVWGEKVKDKATQGEEDEAVDRRAISCKPQGFISF